MDDKYKIDDNRESSFFKTKTFSGFKKNDVFKALFQSIEKGKLENACNWTTECIISGYLVELLDKCISFASKIIHLNSPNLPYYLYRKVKLFYNIIDLDLKKSAQKENLIHYRNNQTIRNVLFDIVTVLTLTTKTKRYDNYPKINETTDFFFENIKLRLKAHANFVPDDMIKFTDPEELKIIMNEIMFQYKNLASGYEVTSYWLSWVVMWEKVNKKKKIKWEIEERKVTNVNPKYCKDVMWLVWQTVLTEANERDENTKLQISSLYNLYKESYAPGKKTLRIPLLYHALGYLTHHVKFNIPIRKNEELFLQTQCNVNFMFKLKKTNEIKDAINPVKKKDLPKKSNIQNEMAQDKFMLLTDIDTLLHSK